MAQRLIMCRQIMLCLPVCCSLMILWVAVDGSKSDVWNHDLGIVDFLRIGISEQKAKDWLSMMLS
jgi:hypothetical protein